MNYSDEITYRLFRSKFSSLKSSDQKHFRFGVKWGTETVQFGGPFSQGIRLKMNVRIIMPRA